MGWDEGERKGREDEEMTGREGNLSWGSARRGGPLSSIREEGGEEERWDERGEIDEHDDPSFPRRDPSKEARTDSRKPRCERYVIPDLSSFSEEGTDFPFFFPLYSQTLRDRGRNWVTAGAFRGRINKERGPRDAASLFFSIRFPYL